MLNRLKREPRAKNQFLNALRQLYGGVEDFDVIVEGGTVQVILQEDDITVPAIRLSDGTLRYLCLLAILCHPAPPPLVCLEEPELGLHPDILPGLADLLREASERCQLIVTTHSDTLVDALTDMPESVVVCEKEKGQNEDEAPRQGRTCTLARKVPARRTLEFRRAWGKSLVNIKVYVEGGGNVRELRSRCRKGFSSFFGKAKLAGRMPQVIACGGRQRTYEKFAAALRSAETKCLSLYWWTAKTPWPRAPDRGGTCRLVTIGPDPTAPRTTMRI